MASVDGFNAVAPPSKPADANTAFADALKRAKEVRKLFKEAICEVTFHQIQFEI